MPDQCSTHPDRSATGRCVRCGGGTCPLCTVEVAGGLYCSILCFTEQALEAKGKTLRVKRNDPLAEALQPGAAPPAADDDPSVVMSAADAEPRDESSIMAPPPSDESSILDMASPKRSGALEESTIAPLQGRMKEPTSILNMGAISKAPDGSWLDEPPNSETPLPILLPGTRRSTMQSTCVFHADTPAVVRCSWCGDPICTMCIADEDQGGRCSPACRRDRSRVRRNRALAVAAALAAALVLGWMFRPSDKGGKPEPAPAIGAAESEARAKEAEERRLEAVAREEARRRVEAREKEEARLKAEAEAEAAARAKEAALKAEAEAKAAAAAALAKAQADAKEALAKAEARAAVEAAAKAAKEKAEAEARAKAEAEARAKEEARLAAEAKAKAEADAKAKAEAEAKTLAVDTSLRKASGLIREATPAFCALADQADSDPDDPRALVPRIDSVIDRLSGARAEYAAIVGEAASRSTLERRIAILDELVAVLREFRVRCNDGR